MKSVSIIIRNLNEGSYLDKVLTGLSVQRDVTSEVILVDNESTDNSLEIARKHRAKVVVFPRKQFTYGRGLNVGLSAAKNEICVILSAHSMPIGKYFLAACCEPFAMPNIAAARCVYAGKGADIERWLKPEILRSPMDLSTIISKGPLASGCVIRRSVWQKIPFDECLAAAEEKFWALEAVNQGHAIYSPCAATYAYLKKLSSNDSVHKNYREIQVVYHKTGVRVGFAARSIPKSLVNVTKSLFWSTPIAAVTAVRVEMLKAYLRCALSFSVRANAKHSTSSKLPSAISDEPAPIKLDR